MIDRGHGSPIVLIPGIQGRWEWMAPTVEALSLRHRVLSFSLGEATVRSGSRAESAHVFDAWESYIDALLDHAGISSVSLIGVSFGGVIAARYASRRPERVKALVLVCAPSPSWQPDRRQTAYLRRPLWFAPAFALRAGLRLVPEIIAAQPTWPARLNFLARHLGRVIRFPASPATMAAWVRQWKAVDPAVDCGRIPTRTLIVTGEAHLDRVVPQASTLEYVESIPGARHVVLPGTGHIGLVSKPEGFATIVRQFIDEPAVTCI
jgi:3-oxoadipate enol-lactonase